MTRVTGGREDPLALDGRTALVTGAGGGIGRATALVLARHGARVVATDAPAARAALAGTREAIAAAGGEAIALEADLAREDEIGALARGAGAVDILAHVAGVHLYPAPLLTMDMAEWDRVQDINVRATLLLCRHLAPPMAARGGGCIVTVASDSAFDVIPGEGAYGVSKIAVTKISAYLARELAGTGVRVNAVAPGWVRTALTQSVWSDPASLAEAEQGIPLRRMAAPEEIAGVVLFLASALSTYVNGHCIVVDGGRIAGVPC